MSEINNIDEMMAMWNQLDQKLNGLQQENRKLAMEIKKNKYRTTLDKLVNKYGRFIVLELVYVILFPIFMIKCPFIVPKYRIVTIIYWTCFFAMEIGFDYYLMDRLKEIDVYECTISQIARLARSNWKIHKLAIFIGLPFSIGGVVLVVLSLGGDSSLIWGVMVGLVVGLIIGLNQLRKFINSYRLLQKED